MTYVCDSCYAPFPRRLMCLPGRWSCPLCGSDKLSYKKGRNWFPVIGFIALGFALAFALLAGVYANEANHHRERRVFRDVMGGGEECALHPRVDRHWQEAVDVRSLRGDGQVTAKLVLHTFRRFETCLLRARNAPARSAMRRGHAGACRAHWRRMRAAFNDWDEHVRLAKGASGFEGVTVEGAAVIAREI